MYVVHLEEEYLVKHCAGGG